MVSNYSQNLFKSERENKHYNIQEISQVQSQ